MFSAGFVYRQVLFLVVFIFFLGYSFRWVVPRDLMSDHLHFDAFRVHVIHVDHLNVVLTVIIIIVMTLYCETEPFRQGRAGV